VVESGKRLRLKSRVSTFDHFLRAWVVTHRLHALDGVMWTLSAVGRGGLVWLLIGASLAAWGRLTWRDFGRLVLAVAIAALVTNQTLKPIIRRERPFVSTPAILVIGNPPADASFPSGHATNAFAGAFVLARVAPGGRVLWWLLAVATAYSRVYLGVHYPLDVIAGGLVGVACAALALRATRRYVADADLRPPG
jgi:undecaprenyl-diphosphatase